MSNIKIFTIVVLAAALTGAANAYAGQGAGGGGRGGGGGAYYGNGGGGGYNGGGGSYYGYGGGGMPYAMDGGGRYGGGNRMRDTPQYEGAPRYADRPAMSHYAARPYLGHRYSPDIHGRPESTGYRDLRFSRNRNAPAGSDRSPDLRTNSARNATSSGAVGGGLHNAANLRFPNARAQLVTSAATAGSQNGRGGHGWSRHRHGGFGWVGSLFWPFAYQDISDYALWGYGYDDPFWEYGYGDIYASMFTPYADDDLTGYRPQKAGPEGGPQVNVRPRGPVAAQPRTAATAQLPAVTTAQPPAAVTAPPPAVVTAPPPAVVTAPPPAVVAAPPPVVATAQPPTVVTAPPPAIATAQPPAIVTAPPPAVATAQPPAVVTAQPPAAVPLQPPAVVTAQPPAIVAAKRRAVATAQPAAVVTEKPPAAVAEKPRAVATAQPPAAATEKPRAVATAQPPAAVAEKPPAAATAQPPALAPEKPRAVATAQPPAAATAQPPALAAQPRAVTAQPRDAVNARNRSAQAAMPDELAQMCGEDSRDIAGLPIDRIQEAIGPNDVQRAALDDLGNASVKAAEIIRAACPTEIALTAPGRLAAMEQRIEGMITAVDTIQPALQKFNDMLSDEQKTRLNAIGMDQRQAPGVKNGALAGNCDGAQGKVAPLPSAEIEAKIHPTDTQRRSLGALRDATTRAANMLNIPCPTSADVVTPPRRLDAVRKRLDVTLQAITIVLAALDDFYGQLSEDQKAQFEAIGQRGPAPADQPGPARTSVRRPHVSSGDDLRRYASMAQW
jgi:hypothetical protein